MKRSLGLALSVGALCAAVALLYQVPAVQSRVGWRLDAASAYVRGVVRPIGAAPTAVITLASSLTPTLAASVTLSPTASPPAATVTPRPTGTTEPTATPTPTPTPTALPGRVALTSPPWEKQSWNNCGAATLSLMLKFYGWQGTQQDIAAVIKPSQEDRNVNVDELLHYVWNYVTWLNARYRVGGNLDTLRAYLAEGLPVIIEEGMPMEQGYWPGDDRWAGHYLLLTGYDDAAGTFTAQDSFYGPDRTVLYADLDANWRAFNRVYMLVYPPEREPTVQALLGPDVEFAVNRQRALQTAQDEVDADDQDVFAWFNLGSNLVFFERYGEAADAFDRVRQLGAPQRMWRYQFSPFLAYFHTDRIDDLVALAEYALQVTPESEEAMLWRGWGLYRQRRVEEAAVEFQAALDMNPGYEDAKYALRFLGLMP